MELPVIDTPVFPRWVWIEEITYSHIPIATLITAYMLLAPLFEYIGYRRKDLRWDRLGKSLIWFAMILFSPGAALGTGIPIFIIGTYPEFWSRWSNLFFWPLIVQFCFFLIEVFFLFFMYYLTWDVWMKRRKRLHIAMGVCAALFGYLVQIVWDSLGGYMLTPGGVALPDVNEPVGWSMAAFFNPSLPFLLSHRTFGNFSYVMLLTGGVLAFRYLGRRRKDPGGEDEHYFHWAANICFLIGFLFFFAQPIIGWFYAGLIHREAPVAFMALMGGHSSHYFILKMALILVFLVLGGSYLTRRFPTPWFTGAATVGLLVLLTIVSIHPPLLWINESPLAWRVLSTGFLLALIAWLWISRGRGNPDHTSWQWVMFACGLAAFFTFCLGGFNREHIKSPDTVYGEIIKPETTPKEANRYLTYQKVLHPLGLLPSQLKRQSDVDPARLIEQARAAGQDVTEDEAVRIAGVLEEYTQ